MSNFLLSGMDETLELATSLIALGSVTPDDAGCQALLGARLRQAGFTVESLPRGEVSNLWATHGLGRPLLVFAGHTDVVPPGRLEAWETPPFEPRVVDGELRGRGAADMKSSLAAMVVACERFVRDHPDHEGTVGLLLTSDEEGEAVDGTVRVVEELEARGCSIDWCVVGEPSSTDRLGDVIKIGRRGSLSGKLRVLGKQGHVAYPHLAENPIHRAVPLLCELASMTWDSGNRHFPPTTFQISNIHAGTGAGNVIPGDLEAWFNFRYSTETTKEQLKARVEQIMESQGLHYEIAWTASAAPFLTPPGELTSAVSRAVEETLGYLPRCSTEGGTSDGRFIARMGAQIVELGPVNATIHQVNERIDTAQLEPLTQIYRRVLEKLCS